MAGKYKRVNVGSVIKDKDKTKPDYIKINPKAVPDLLQALQNYNEEQGLFLNLESKESQLNGIELAVENGKLSPENAAKARERIEGTPSFVRFQIVLVSK